MSWEATRDAIQAALVSASGLPAGRVIWKYQDVNQPALDYVAISIGSILEKGQDYIRTTQDLTRPAGKEIEMKVVGWREMSLSIEVYSAAQVASASADDALAIGSRIRSALTLPSVRATMATVGVVPFDIGPTSYLPTIAAAGFRGRSVTDIRCLMPAESVSEYTGYIAKVSGTISALGGGGSNVRPYSEP